GVDHLLDRIARLVGDVARGTAAHAVAARDEQRDAAQALDEIHGVVRLPGREIDRRIAPDAGSDDPGDEEHVGRGYGVKAIYGAGEARGGAEEIGVASGVTHRAEAAHREPGDGAVAPARERPEASLDEASQDDGVKRLPLARAVDPVGVPAGVRVVTTVRHDDDDRE